jgi:hypothetical protein
MSQKIENQFSDALWGLLMDLGEIVGMNEGFYGDFSKILGTNE